MNKLLTWLLSVAPQQHKIPVRLFQIRYQRAKRIACAVLTNHMEDVLAMVVKIKTLLLPPALTREV